MAEIKPGHAGTSTEDMQRLRRLSEEIRARLLEIALIMARNTDMNLKDGSKIKFVPRDRALRMRGDWIEIIDVDGEEACYGVIGGVPFAESPCGG